MLRNYLLVSNDCSNDKCRSYLSSEDSSTILFKLCLVFVVHINLFLSLQTRGKPMQSPETDAGLCVSQDDSLATLKRGDIDINLFDIVS